MLYIIFILIIASALCIGRYFSSSRPKMPAELIPKRSAGNWTDLRKFGLLLKPFIALAGVIAGKPKVANWFSKRIVMAGLRLGAVELIAVKIAGSVLTLIFALILFNASPYILSIFLAALIVGFFLPDIWLAQKIAQRHRRIRMDLPFVTDILNLAVGAGLDFMLAVGLIVKEFTRSPITGELELTLGEIRMGASRKEALENMAQRVNMPEIYSFVRSLVQAERMGTPLAETLKMLSEDVRMQRFMKAEEMALKAPIKLLFPLFFFILPAVLAVVGGPIFLQFMRGNIKF